MYDAVIIGAGPAGLAAAHAAQEAELDYLVVERQCIVHTIYQFPTGLVFYSTPELISVGDVPMIIQGSNHQGRGPELLPEIRRDQETQGKHLRGSPQHLR